MAPSGAGKDVKSKKKSGKKSLQNNDREESLSPHRSERSLLRQLFHWGPILTLTVITSITLSSLYCISMWYPPLSSWHAFAHIVVFHFWLFAILYNFLMAAYLGAGYVPYGWAPEDDDAEIRLQFCHACNGYKPPRSHHCRKCARCSMKMDHHCPWINTCCGYRNHTRFIYFLLFCILGCSHATYVLGCSVYRAIFLHYYFVHYPQDPPVYLGITSFIASLFSAGLAVGVVISVAVLLYVQMKVILKNETSIESWILDKARHRATDIIEFPNPYNLGKRNNFSQVLNHSGNPKGDGFWWEVVEGCDQFTLTDEQLRQKEEKRLRARDCVIVEEYSGYWFPCTKGLRVCLCFPWSDEPRMAIHKGESVRVTRWQRRWLYGTKLDGKEGSSAIRGWFPRQCAIDAATFNFDRDNGIPEAKKTR